MQQVISFQIPVKTFTFFPDNQRFKNKKRLILPTTALVIAEAGPAAVAVVGAAVAVAQPGPQLPHHHQQLAGGWRTGAMAALAVWLSSRGRPAARWVLQ